MNTFQPRRSGPRRGFIERSLASFSRSLQRAMEAEDYAKATGLLQRVDPRAKAPGLLALVVAAAVVRRLDVILALFVVALALSKLSTISIRMLAKRVWIAVFVFTGLIALPAPFLTPGRVVGRLPWAGWPVTAQGLTSAAFLVSRVETAATFSALLILSTPWNQVLRAFRTLRIPPVAVAILGMTYRYLFLLLDTAGNMFEARKSRIIGKLSGAEQRRVAASSAGVLLSKSLRMSSEVYAAMQSRGYRGEVYALDRRPARSSDWLTLVGFVALAAAAVWLGR